MRIKINKIDFFGKWGFWEFDYYFLLSIIYLYILERLER